MRILCAVPTFENIMPEVFKAIYDLDTGEHDVDFEFVKGYDCAKARSTICRKAIDGNYDYVLMVDADTLIPKDALTHLLDPPADVVLGCCPRKNTKDRMTVLYPKSENPPNKGFKRALSYDDLQDKRIPLKGGGMACALIKVSILSRLNYPYFKYVVYPDGSALSEDLYFCRECVRAGFKVEAEPRVRCGHLARYYQYE